MITAAIGIPAATKRPGGEVINDGSSGVMLRLTEVTSNAGAFEPGGAGTVCARPANPLAVNSAIAEKKRAAIGRPVILGRACRIVRNVDSQSGADGASGPAHARTSARQGRPSQ